MIRFVTALLLLLVTNPARAQTEMWSSVIASAGGMMAHEQIRLYSTLGQLAVETETGRASPGIELEW